MRKLRKEILWFLYLAEGAPDVLGNTEPLPLEYSHFTELRPEYGASSWRVLLAKLVQEKLVLKDRSQGKTRFRLTQFGVQHVRQELLTVLEPTTNEGVIVLLKPVKGRKIRYTAFERIMAENGYQKLLTGVFWRVGPLQYSDYLWRELQRRGAFAIFQPVDRAAARPSPLEALLQANQAEESATTSPDSTSKQVSELLSKNKVRKTLKIKEKAEIGQVLISGLSVIQETSKNFQSGNQAGKDTLGLVEQLVSLLQESANIPIE